MARKISVEIIGSSESLERAFARSSRSAKGFDRDIGRAGRGVAAATLGFHGLGRSVAFASSAFIGAAGIAVGVKEAISGAESLKKAQESVRTVLERTGQAVGRLTPQYLATAKAAARLGVDQATALGGLATATTLTGNAAAAMRAYVEALNISKVTHKAFASVLTATAKGQEGITTSLQRYGIALKKGTSGQEQFRVVMSRFGGQARANTSDLDRLKASASNLAAQLGGPLLKATEFVARGLTAAIGGISRFAGEIGAAHTFKAKISVVWSNVKDVGRDLIGAFRSIDWNSIEAAVGAQLRRLGTALQHVDFSKVGHLVGEKIGHALAGIASFVGRVPWAKVGKAIVDGIGAAVVFTVHALPGILNGLARLTAKILVGSLQVLKGAAAEIGRGIVAGIKRGFEAAVHGLERLALKAVLAIIEPFTHLPGFLGGGPFREMKDQFQRQLGGMEKAAKKTAASIAGSMGDLSKSVFQVFAGLAQKHAADHAPRPRGNPQLGTSGGNTPAAASTTVAQGFTPPFRLQLAQAKASATATIKDDLKVAREIRAFILKAIPHLHGQKLIDAYNQLGQINQEIASDVKQAVKKAKKAVTSFTLPPKLDLALARDAALGLDPTKDLLKAKAAILKFIRTHKKNIAALTDAYNQLAAINQQLASTTSSALGGFKQASTKALTAGIGLTPADRKKLRERLSQLGPGGTVPGQGVGAGGFIIDPATGRPIKGDQAGRATRVSSQQTADKVLRLLASGRAFKNEIHLTVELDGKAVGRSVTNYRHRKRERNPTQTRGPNAATSAY